VLDELSYEPERASKPKKKCPGKQEVRNAIEKKLLIAKPPPRYSTVPHRRKVQEKQRKGNIV
jgi:hypothetical protein